MKPASNRNRLAFFTGFILFFCLLFGYGQSYCTGSESIDSLQGLIARFDSTSCRECHEKVYEQWVKSHHARSLMGLDDWIFMAPYLKAGPLAIKKGQQAQKNNFPCAKCHLPQLKHGTEEVAAELGKAILGNDKTTIGQLNIGCLVCHNEKAVVHGRPEKNVIYGSKDIPDHPGMPVKVSPLLKQPLMCGQCHGLGPNLEFETPVQCATLYGSYLHGYIPSGGTGTCQDCHMKDGDHYMPPDFNDRPEISKRLQQSLPMEVNAMAYTFEPKEGDSRPMIVLRTKIFNKAGHRIPDG